MEKKMSIVRKSFSAAATGALIALLGLGDVALAQSTPDASSAPAAATPAPAAKMAPHKMSNVQKHRHHAKTATEPMKPAKTPAKTPAETPATNSAPMGGY
jgi:hypothetical protein